MPRRPSTHATAAALLLAALLALLFAHQNLRAQHTTAPASKPATAQAAEFSQTAKDLARQVATLLPAGWSATADGNEVKITRKDPVEWHGTISMPPYSKAELKERGYVRSKTYTIRVQILPPMTPDQVADRVKHNEDVIEDHYARHPGLRGTKGGSQLPTDVRDSLQPVPSIFRRESSLLVTASIEGYRIAFYDPNDKAECVKVLADVKQSLNESSTAPTQPATGGRSTSQPVETPEAKRVSFLAGKVGNDLSVEAAMKQGYTLAAVCVLGGYYGGSQDGNSQRTFCYGSYEPMQVLAGKMDPTRESILVCCFVDANAIDTSNGPQKGDSLIWITRKLTDGCFEGIKALSVTAENRQSIVAMAARTPSIPCAKLPTDDELQAAAAKIRKQFSAGGVDMWKALADLIQPGMTLRQVHMIRGPAGSEEWFSAGTHSPIAMLDQALSPSLALRAYVLPRFYSDNDVVISKAWIEEGPQARPQATSQPASTPALGPATQPVKEATTRSAARDGEAVEKVPGGWLKVRGMEKDNTIGWKCTFLADKPGAEETLVMEGFPAMSSAIELSASPDGKYLAVWSECEACFDLTIMDLPVLLGQHKVKEMGGTGAWLGGLEMGSWKGQAIEVRSCELLTPCAGRGDASPFLFPRSQDFLVDAATGKVTAVSMEAKNPIPFFTGELSAEDDERVCEASWALAQLRAVQSLPALRAALAAAADENRREVLHKAIVQLEAATQPASSPAGRANN